LDYSIIKIYLFKFLNSNAKTRPVLVSYLASFNCISWQEYLRKFLPLVDSVVKSERESHIDIVVEEGLNFDNICEFIEKVIIQQKDDMSKDDFLMIRSKPLYRIKKGVYRIIFGLFVVEKIYKGIYFSLRDTNEKLPKSIKVKELRSLIGYEFSEKTLCYNAFKNIYINNCIQFTGKQLEDLQVEAAPDYYIRKGENILLIESKDFLISVDKKMSFDFNIYENEFARILDFEITKKRTKNKAVMQLIGSIRKILKNEFSADSDYKYKNVFIYPILLTHDQQYDAPGFNELLNEWFQDELINLENEGLFINRIKPIVTINIDSLLYHQVCLREKIPLHKMINLYLRYKKEKHSSIKFFRDEFKVEKIDLAKIVKKYLPFAFFIDKYCEKNKLFKPPYIIDDVLPELYK
jgi:hypothetical protein